jgi:hypothetical protein
MTPIVSKQVIANKARTQAVYSIGGALNNKPNTKAPKEKKVPTYFVSSPACSSLPYLPDEAKVTTNESIVKLAIAHANLKQRLVFDYNYDEKERARNEVKLESVNRLREFYQPKTSDLLNSYLLNAESKRIEELVQSNNLRQRGLTPQTVSKSITDLERQRDEARNMNADQQRELERLRSMKEDKKFIADKETTEKEISSSDLGRETFGLERLFGEEEEVEKGKGKGIPVTPAQIAKIKELKANRGTTKITNEQIAKQVGVSISTVKRN